MRCQLQSNFWATSEAPGSLVYNTQRAPTKTRFKKLLIRSFVARSQLVRGHKSTGAIRKSSRKQRGGSFLDFLCVFQRHAQARTGKFYSYKSLRSPTTAEMLSQVLYTVGVGKRMEHARAGWSNKNER